MLIKLCQTTEVSEGKPVAVNVADLPPLAVYQIGDDYFVTDNMCTHGNAMLSDGYQEGGIIECPFHGGSFDIRTGAPKAFPCQVAVTIYPVVIENGHIAIKAP